MKRIKLTVSYDGTNYVGWQVQKNGLAVEQVLNEELSRLLGEDIAVIGASRTDSGVHALGNVAVFDTRTRIPPEKISYALNQSLPEDIRIARSEEVPFSFHPRKEKCAKTYRYNILNSRYNIPVLRLYSDYVYYPMDLKKMRQGAVYLKGEHDFTGFSSSGGQQKTSVRTIYSLDIEAEELGSFKDNGGLFMFGDEGAKEPLKASGHPGGEYAPRMVSLTVRGNGFLYNMVRIIAGTLEKVAMGVYPPEYIKKILDSRDRSLQTSKAPARGLTLMSIDYGDSAEK